VLQFSLLVLIPPIVHTHLSSGSGITGQIVADVPSGHSLTPPHPTKLKKKKKEQHEIFLQQL
jgi:hypothetical protein